MLRNPAWLSLLILAVACGRHEAPKTRLPVEFCAGPTELVYDPLAGTIWAFPDDFYTIDDTSTPTGLRVHMVHGDNIRIPAEATDFANIFTDLSTLDGFGTTGTIELVLSAPLDPATLPARELSGAAGSTLILVDLDSGETVPLEWEQVPERPGEAQTTLVISPMITLQPMARYGLALTTAARGLDGGCVAPSPAMRSLLAGHAEEPSLARLTGRYAALVERLVELGAIDDAGDLSAALVFTTQHTYDASLAVARDIRTRVYTYDRGECVGSDEGIRTCEGALEAADYRVAGRALDESQLTPQEWRQVPVTTYLPEGFEPPYPTIIFGHGLAGKRQQAHTLARFAGPLGYATVAIDAVAHGDHPDAPASADLSALDFFGIFTQEGTVLDALQLRDNWRQSTYDRLQLVEMLRPGVDIDGDGLADVDIDHLMYVGASLGGIMSAELLALVPEVQLAVAIVPGARVSDIIREGDDLSFIVELMRGGSSDGAVARFFPLLQTLIDRGDAGVYAPHVMARRFPGFDGARPQLLMQMVIGDTILPNSTNLFFARDLGLPHVGDELLPVGGVPRAPVLPVSANIDDGLTGGIFQYDIIVSDDGVEETATHNNVGDSGVAVEQTFHFVQSYLLAGVAEIIDPYRTLGVKAR